MSANHSHPGQHDPHSHHPHDHDHDHPHAHGPAVGAGPGPEIIEDAGAIALSDALRSSFLIVRVILAFLVAYFLVSNVSFVGTQERAIVLRFGKPILRGGQIEQGPGLVWAFPYPVDEVKRIPVTQLQTATSTVGWFQITREQEEAGVEPDAGASLNPAIDGYNITGDGNIIHARAIIRYRITEPVKYYLNHRDGPTLITNLIDNALTFAASRYRVDDALRRNLVGFQETVLKRLQEIVIAHDVGVTIEPSAVLTRPPRQVTAEFNAVLNAEQERGKTISDAQAYLNRVVNEASGQAEARINSGRTERNRLIQAVSSEAESFKSLLPEYLKNPEFFRSHWQTEALRRILTNAHQKFPLSTRHPNDQLWLHLNKDAEAPPKPPIL